MRGVLAHLGTYVILIGMLAGINLLTSTEVLWFVYPALIWGAGVALHLLFRIPVAWLKPKWRKFLRHLGVYIIIISILAGINIVTSIAVLWFLYPALVWGAGLALHFLFGIVLAKKGPETNAKRLATARRGHAGPPSLGRPANQTPWSLANKTTQLHLNKALLYKTRIDDLIKTMPGENGRAHLQHLAAQIDEWLEAVQDLAWRIDSFQRDPLIRQDLASLPKLIRELEVRLAGETNEANRIALERTLLNRQKQLASLEQLGNVVKRAEIQIECTLSALGTIYSQLLTGQSASHIADYSHLSAEVDEHVYRLQDHLEALEEIKLSRI